MKVAVLGFGTVGVGVYEMLKNAECFEAGPVLVRPDKNDEPFKVASIEDIINDLSIDAVAEVMGGIEPAFTYVSAAIRAGKHAVTSNKALVATHGTELSRLAAENNVAFLFSAACGGAVPFLHNLALASESDEILSVGGILNGTTNYILDSMQTLGISYDAALSDAQRLGYAEADPTADITGLDALRKIMLACSVAYNKLPVSGLLNEGIDSFSSSDVRHIKSLGLTCRLIASGSMAKNKSVQAYVEPVLFPEDAPECSVHKNFNMAKYTGKNSGTITFTGQGAGRYPTASAVVRDLSDIVHGRRKMMLHSCETCVACNLDEKHAYYVRTGREFASHFVSDTVFADEKEARIITVNMSVHEMHSKARSIRESGGKIFFAAIG